MARCVAEVRAAWKAVEYYRVCGVSRSGGKSHVHDYTQRRFFLHDSHIREVSVISNHAMERTPNALIPAFPMQSAFGLPAYVAASPHAPFGVAHLVSS